MTQRFTEVVVPSIGEVWLNHEISGCGHATAEDAEYPEKAGGQTFTSPLNFMAKWRTSKNVAEVMLVGVSKSVPNRNIRITCQYACIAGSVCVTCTQSQILLMFASSYHVHVVVLAISSLDSESLLKISSSGSYPINTESPIVHCTAQATDEFGIVFSLVSSNCQLFAASIQNGAFEQTELKQTSIISSIWKKVRRSMISGTDDGSNIVCATISDEHPSIYCLTKDFLLQQWSIGTWECLGSYNLNNYVAANHYISGKSLKFFSSHPKSLLAVHFTDGRDCSKVMMLSLSAETGQVADCSMLADCDENTMISYEVVGDLLFALWRTPDEQYQLCHVSINGTDQMFLQSHLKSPLLQSMELHDEDDPRQVFTDQIFQPSQLCVPALLKAVHMLDPQAAGDLMTVQLQYNLDELKELTWKAISNEVEEGAASIELTNEELRDLHVEVWRKFHVDLAHHHKELIQPLGIVSGGAGLPIALVRKGVNSYMRPCEGFEQQILFPDEPLDNSVPVNQDVVTMMKSMAMLYDPVEGFEEHVYMCILHGQSIDDVIREVVGALVSRPEHMLIKARFKVYVQDMNLLRDAFAVFLQLQDPVNQLTQQQRSNLTTEGGVESNPFYMMSKTGQYIVCSSVQDMISSRYKLSCILCLFLEYLSQLSEEVDKSAPLQATIEDELSTCKAQLRAYASLVWLCNLTPTSSDQELYSAEVIEALKSTNNECMAVMLELGSSDELSVLAGFMSGYGGLRVKAMLPPSPAQPSYYEHLNALILAACQAIWPEAADSGLAEFMLASQELSSLQTYCTLLEGYCQASASLRSYLLGQSYLVQGCPEEAYVHFEQALCKLIDDDGNEMEVEQATDGEQFCFKVINLFESLSCYEQIIRMAKKALKYSPTNQPTLHSILFRYSLELGRYDEAYNAILNNPDVDRKMNCLRQFVPALCERGEVATLLSYSYKDELTHEDHRPALVNILLCKARSADLTINNYYDLLYAFHVTNNDLLSAANVMYECCERVKCELSGLSALQKKANCYLACIHALHCVDPNSAWIAPASFTQSKYIASGKSPKRMSHGREKVKSSSPARIRTLADIEKEYVLVNMAMRLAKEGCSQISGTSYLDAREVATLLCNMGMYDEAIQVCDAYSLSLSPMFDSLTFRCLQMNRDKDSGMLHDDIQDQTWLTYNMLPTETTYSSPCDQAWKILRHYLDKYETVSTKHHRVVASKLLAHGASLPEWFLASYKQKNVAELLRVYMQHDLIEQAVNLSVDYLQALTGHTYESFGLEGPLSATMNPSSVLVPYTQVDLLLNVLADHQHDPYYKKLHNKMKKAVINYTHELEDKSRDAERKLLIAAR